MVEIRVPQDRLVETHGAYEIWLATKILPQRFEGRDITPSQTRRTMVVYSVRRKNRNGTYIILRDNLVNKAAAITEIQTLTTFERL